MQARSILIATLFHGAVLVGVGIGVQTRMQEPRLFPEIALQPLVPEPPLPEVPKMVVEMVPPEVMEDAEVAEPESAPPPAPPPAPRPDPAAEDPAPEVVPVFSTPEAVQPSEDLLVKIRRAPTPVVAQTPPASARASVPDVPAKLLDEHNRPPEYPRPAQRRGVGGEVRLLVHVDPSGEVERVEVLQSAGLTWLHKLLDKAAIAAACCWRYTPAQSGGRAVSARIEVPVEFRPKPRR